MAKCNQNEVFMSRFFPKPFADFPTHLSEFWEEDTELGATYPGGLSIYEEEDQIIIEAAMPGIQPNAIDVIYEQNTLYIRGEKKEEEEKKKYYRKASSSYSYRVLVPRSVDKSKEPDATTVNGVIRIKFPKLKKNLPEPKKIKVKHED